MAGFDLRRRGLVGGLLAAPALLGGCKVLDLTNDRDAPVRNFIESANRLTYRAQRLLTGGTRLAPEYQPGDIRQSQHPNGVTAPQDEDYLALASGDFAGYALTVDGLVEAPQVIDRATLLAMPAQSQITRHDCVEGWSCIAKWTGVRLSSVLELAKPRIEARFAVFHCYDTIERSLAGAIKYYESIDLIDAWHPQTILAYGLNDKPLPVSSGAPLRVRVERQLGYKMAKYIRRIELVSNYTDIGEGNGSYWADRGYDWYAGI